MISIVVYWPPTRLDMPFQRPGSCIFHWRGQAWLTIWDRVKIPRYSHRLMLTKRVTCELHDSYFRLMTIKHAISKIEWAIVLVYNSVKIGSQFEFWRAEIWRQDVVEKASTQQEAGPRASGWATLENEKDTTLMAIRVGRSVCGSFIRSPTPSHTQHFQIKWEVYFSERLCRSSLLCHWVYACISIIWIYISILLIENILG